MTEALKDKEMLFEEYDEKDPAYITDLQTSWDGLTK